jgi:uncharacterized protein YecE (DUF72 family)
VKEYDSEGLYSSCYSDEELSRWAQRIAGLGKTVRISYIYFNNDAEAFAVENAMTLRNLLQSLRSEF